MLPTDLLKLIWHITYGVAPPLQNVNPLLDLLRVLDIQNSIPTCLLRDRLPTSKFETEDRQLFLAWQLFPPNPFKKDNPYIPSCCVTTKLSPWSQLGSEMFRLLSKDGIRKLRTYPAVLRRKYNKHINRSVFEWNDSFEELFSATELCKPENYNLKLCNWAFEFKHVVLSQLSRARFLTV